MWQWRWQGITADANILINQARLHAQRYRFSYQEPQPRRAVGAEPVREKQAYTQFGGLRPFGVSMLYARVGQDTRLPAVSVGPIGQLQWLEGDLHWANNQSAMSLMKQEYKEEIIPLTSALQLAMKVLTKTCDATTLTPDKFDLATLTRSPMGKIVYHEYSEAESQKLAGCSQGGGHVRGCLMRRLPPLRMALLSSLLQRDSGLAVSETRERVAREKTL